MVPKNKANGIAHNGCRQSTRNRDRQIDRRRGGGEGSGTWVIATAGSAQTARVASGGRMTGRTGRMDGRPGRPAARPEVGSCAGEDPQHQQRDVVARLVAGEMA